MIHKKLLNIFIFTAILFFLLTTVRAASISVDVDSLARISDQYIQWKGIMPCNWDQDINRVVIYGYFSPGDRGQEFYQDIINYQSIRSSVRDSARNIMELVITLKDEITGQVAGKALDHIEVDFRATRRRCKDSPFGGFFGSPYFHSQ